MAQPQSRTLPRLDPYHPTATEEFITQTFQGKRLAHILKVAERVTHTLSQTPCLHQFTRLGRCAALLHDIGYLQSLKETGFHPIDGAWFLQSLGAPDLASYIICHSHAPEYAKLMNLPYVPVSLHPIASIITFWDVRVAPGGHVLSYEERMEEIQQRHGSTSITCKAHKLARERIRQDEHRLRQIPSIVLN